MPEQMKAETNIACKILYNVIADQQEQKQPIYL
jgi:hypothetical protein